MPSALKSWSDIGAVAFILVVVSAIYGVRLTHQPIVGEESRWGTGAREMLATGDWVVPRQQGRVFPERPPMTMWAMAAVGHFRGEVDTIAVRLPSVLAIVLTSLVIYGYTRAHASSFAAFAAALCYATLGQVLQIGRMGESEALFTFFLSASLLTWHLGYSRDWPPAVTWCSGFAFAALGALVKGPQAPVYFGAITGVYLLVRRDWRYLLNWSYLAGGALLVGIIALWQVPFYLATDWEAVRAIWSGLAADRVQLSGLLEHLLMYPLETFVCLLPWSPLLVTLTKRDTRALLADQKPLVQFLVVALIVAYPTVWIAAGARGRYFMPLYPLVAILVGLVIERCSVAELKQYPRRAWHQYLLLVGLLLAVVCVLAWLPADWAMRADQPVWYCVALSLLTAIAIWTFWKCYRSGTLIARTGVIMAIAVVAGAMQAGVMIHANVARWNDPTASIARLKQLIPPSATLVSLSPIEHRFAYFYRTPIAEYDWPQEASDLPLDMDYFCFMRQPGDTAEQRAAGRGRSWTTTPGTLPVAWEEIATLRVERRLRDRAQPTVVIGRIVKPRQEIVSDATVSQPRSLNLTAGKKQPTLTR